MIQLNCNRDPTSRDNPTHSLLVSGLSIQIRDSGKHPNASACGRPPSPEKRKQGLAAVEFPRSFSCWLEAQYRPERGYFHDPRDSIVSLHQIRRPGSTAPLREWEARRVEWYSRGRTRIRNSAGLHPAHHPKASSSQILIAA